MIARNTSGKPPRPRTVLVLWTISATLGLGIAAIPLHWIRVSIAILLWGALRFFLSRSRKISIGYRLAGEIVSAVMLLSILIADSVVQLLDFISTVSETEPEWLLAGIPFGSGLFIMAYWERSAQEKVTAEASDLDTKHLLRGRARLALIVLTLGVRWPLLESAWIHVWDEWIVSDALFVLPVSLVDFVVAAAVVAAFLLGFLWAHHRSAWRRVFVNWVAARFIKTTIDQDPKGASLEMQRYRAYVKKTTRAIEALRSRLHWVSGVLLGEPPAFLMSGIAPEKGRYITILSDQIEQYQTEMISLHGYLKAECCLQAFHSADSHNGDADASPMWKRPWEIEMTHYLTRGFEQGQRLLAENGYWLCAKESCPVIQDIERKQVSNKKDAYLLCREKNCRELLSADELWHNLIRLDRLVNGYLLLYAAEPSGARRPDDTLLDKFISLLKNELHKRLADGYERILSTDLCKDVAPVTAYIEHRKKFLRALLTPMVVRSPMPLSDDVFPKLPEEADEIFMLLEEAQDSVSPEMSADIIEVVLGEMLALRDHQGVVEYRHRIRSFQKETRPAWDEQVGWAYWHYALELPEQNGTGNSGNDPFFKRWCIEQSLHHLFAGGAKETLKHLNIKA